MGKEGQEKEKEKGGRRRGGQRQEEVHQGGVGCHL